MIPLSLKNLLAGAILQSSDDCNIPVQERIFDVVQSRVQKYAGVIPGSALDTDRFMQAAHLLQRLGDDGDIVLAEEGCIEAIVRPDNVLDTTHSHLCQRLLRLDVEESNRRRKDKQ